MPTRPGTSSSPTPVISVLRFARAASHGSRTRNGRTALRSSTRVGSHPHPVRRRQNGRCPSDALRREPSDFDPKTLMVDRDMNGHPDLVRVSDPVVEAIRVYGPATKPERGDVSRRSARRTGTTLHFLDQDRPVVDASSQYCQWAVVPQMLGKGPRVNQPTGRSSA
jgi:hypothetical protein